MGENRKDLFDSTARNSASGHILQNPIHEISSPVLSVSKDFNGNAYINQVAGVESSFQLALAIVAHEGQVLVLKRRKPYGPLLWGFPAGIVKPEDIAYEVAERETLSETSVQIKFRSVLGRRRHPVTLADSHYFACTYIKGKPVNLDPRENVECRWYPILDLTTLIPREQIFVPVMTYLSGCVL